VRLGDQTGTVTVTGRDVFVTNVDGRRLDPSAATVLLALGGPEPAWLKAVESISAVAWCLPGDRRSLEIAVEALGWPRDRLAKAAATTDSPAIMLVAAVHGVVNIGRNAHCTPAAWDILRRHRDADVRRKALTANAVLPATLAVIDDEETLVRVARNPECPPEVLRQLETRSSAINRIVVHNPSAPRDVLDRAARSSDIHLRMGVAGNPSCPRKRRGSLLIDRYAEVRSAAIGNKKLVPRWRAAARLYADLTPAVHLALARRRDMGPLTLRAVERYARGDPLQTYLGVCHALEAHPRCPARLVRRMKRQYRRVEALPQEQRAKLNAPRRPVGQMTLRGSAVAAPVLAAAAAIALVIGVLLFLGGHYLGGAVTIGVSILVVAGAICAVGLAQRRRSPTARPRPLWLLPPPRLAGAGVRWLAMLAALLAIDATRPSAEAPFFLVLLVLVVVSRGAATSRVRRRP
jgi:hypothetical protein